MKYTIDRFEGNFAVVELGNKKFVDVPKEAIPPEAKEGDIIKVEVDAAETKKRKDKIQGLMNDLFAD